MLNHSPAPLSSLPFETHRQTEALIDASAFRANLTFAQSLCGKAQLMAVVKADAYGHGILPLAREALDWGAPFLAVATVDEALLLRETNATNKAKILVMGPTFPESAPDLIDNQISVAIGSLNLLSAWCNAAARREVKPLIHLKMDTGMGRYGLKPNELLEGLNMLNQERISLEGIMTHYAVSDELAPEHVEFTKKQTSLFQQLIFLTKKHHPAAIVHTGNSGAVLIHSTLAFDFQRPGMMLYGAHPNPAETCRELSPVMTLQTRVISTHTHDAGTTISYGRTFEFPQGGSTAILPIGYGDGLPRELSNNGDVLIRGERFPIVGRVCMDQIMIDISRQPDISVGEPCVLIGKQGHEEIRLEEMALRARTIPYEITCQIGRRIPRRIINSTLPPHPEEGFATR